MKCIGSTLFGVALGMWLLAPALAVDGTSGTSGYATKDRETGQLFDSQDPPHTIVQGTWTQTATGHSTVTINTTCYGAGQHAINVTTATNTGTMSGTGTGSATASATSTASASATSGYTTTETVTCTGTIGATETLSGTVTVTNADTVTLTVTASATVTDTTTDTTSGTGTVTMTGAEAATETAAWTDTVSKTATGAGAYIGTCPAGTSTLTHTGVVSESATSTGTATGTVTGTSTVSASWTWSSTGTETSSCAGGSASTVTTTAATTGLHVFELPYATKTTTVPGTSTFVATDFATTGTGSGIIPLTSGLGKVNSGIIDYENIPTDMCPQFTGLNFGCAGCWNNACFTGTVSSSAISAENVEVTNLVTSGENAIVCGGGLICSGVAGTGTGTATATGTGTYRLLNTIPVTVQVTATGTATITNTLYASAPLYLTEGAGTTTSTSVAIQNDPNVHISTGTSAGTVAVGNDGRFTKTFILPNATKTATASVTLTQTDIGTTTPAAGAIPIAGTDGNISVGWLPGIVLVGATTSVETGTVSSTIDGYWTDLLSVGWSDSVTSTIHVTSAVTMSANDAVYCGSRITLDGTMIGAEVTERVSYPGAVGWATQFPTASAVMTPGSHTVKVQIISTAGSQCTVSPGGAGGRASLTVMQYGG